MYVLVIEVIFICGTATGQLQLPVACRGPLTNEQLTRLLTSGVADARIQAFVQQCAVDFEPTVAIYKRLKQVGASDALLRIVHSHSPKAQQAGQLRLTIQHDIDAGVWADAKARLADLRALVPDDDQVRSWAAAIDEHERAAQSQQEELEQKHREQLRIAELRRKLGLESPALRDLPANLSLDEASQRLHFLKGRLSEIETRLKKQYPELQTNAQLTKDNFETTADYEARVAKALAKRKELEGAYDKDLRELCRAYDSQISELFFSQYDHPGLNVELGNYDADKGLLSATIGTFVYVFEIQPDRARKIYTDQDALEAKGNFLQVEEEHLPFATNITLFDLKTNETLKSIPISPEYATFSSNSWALNGSARVMNNRLQLTSEKKQRSSACFTPQVDVRAFTMNFGFQLSRASCDGFTVVFQTSSQNALGYALGYAEMQYSLGIKFECTEHKHLTTGIVTNGDVNGQWVVPLGLNIFNGEVYNSHLAYDGETLSLTLTDRANPDLRYSTSWRVNIPEIVKSRAAWVGFTADTGRSASTQEITDWVFVASPTLRRP